MTEGGTEKGRLKLTNGYDISFEQIARLLSLVCSGTHSRISSQDLLDNIGVSENHALCLGRMAHAMGLLLIGSYRPTPLGILVYHNDLFCDDIGTLWFLHYAAASNERNTVWHRLFNRLLQDKRSFTRDDFRDLFEDLRDQFTSSSFRPYLNKETKSLLDAYTNQNFGRLAYLREDGDGYVLAYREPIPPLVLAACITRYRDQQRPGDTALSVSDLLNSPNSPGIVCQIPEDRLRAGLEALKTQPGFSLESRADLDQVRLTDNTPDSQWMERYFANRH